MPTIMNRINKHLEIAKLESELKELKKVLKCIDDLVFKVDKSGTVLDCWTNRAQDLFYDIDYIMNRPIEEMFDKEFRDKIIEVITKTIAQNRSFEISYDSPRPGPGGQSFLMRTKNLDPQEGIVLLMVTNTTLETQLLDRVRENQEKFHQAFHNSSVGMALLDEHMVVIEHNSELLSMLRPSFEGEIRGIGFLDFLLPPQREQVEDQISGIEQGRPGRIREEVILNSDTGTWCSLSISPVLGRGAKVLYYVCHLKDLSPQKANEEKLLAQRSLLESINFDLQVKIRQLETFSQVLSHDLRSPLANNHMLAEQIKDLSGSPEANVLADMLLANNRRFSRRFEQLTGFLESLGQDDYQFKENDLETILQEALGVFGDKKGYAEIRLISDLLQRSVNFPARYLISLFRYAVKKFLVGRSSPVDIRVTSTLQNGSVMIGVHCAGSAKVGESGAQFSRPVDQVRQQELEDMAVDLYIARGQVRSYGGNVRFLDEGPERNSMVINIPLG